MTLGFDDSGKFQWDRSASSHYWKPEALEAQGLCPHGVQLGTDCEDCEDNVIESDVRSTEPTSPVYSTPRVERPVPTRSNTEPSQPHVTTNSEVSIYTTRLSVELTKLSHSNGIS